VPRIADANLSERILDAAYEIVKKLGAEAVTLRAVAVRAKTTTPTVYARFETREDLLLALANRLRLKFASEMMQQPTLQKAAESYLRQATEHPHDYHLIYEIGWPKIFHKDGDQPGVTWTRERMAELHGGSPKDYVFVVECLWMELHGGASFISKAPNSAVSKRFYKNCLHACDVIVANAPLFRR
jgi:AcrR family transcriptional regulator